MYCFCIHLALFISCLFFYAQWSVERYYDVTSSVLKEIEVGEDDLVVFVVNFYKKDVERYKRRFEEFRIEAKINHSFVEIDFFKLDIFDAYMYSKNCHVMKLPTTRMLIL